jgi:recombination protein RecA
MVELLGPPQSGKTTLCLALISSVLAQGGSVAFLDASQQLDVLASAGQVPRFRDMLVTQCNELEESLEIARILVAHQAVDLLVLDPISSLVPRAELDAPMHSGGLGTPSIFLRDAFHRLHLALSKSTCSLLAVDVLRDCDEHPVGTMETTAATRTITPFSSIRLQIRVDPPTTLPGSRYLRVVKNHLGSAGSTIPLPTMAILHDHPMGATPHG